MCLWIFLFREAAKNKKNPPKNPKAPKNKKPESIIDILFQFLFKKCLIMLLQRKSKEMALLNKKSLRAYGYFMSPGLRVNPLREKSSFVYAIEGR